MKMYKIIEAAISDIMKCREVGKSSTWRVAMDNDFHLWFMYDNFAAVRVPDEMDAFDSDKLAEFSGHKLVNLTNMIRMQVDEKEVGYDAEVPDTLDARKTLHRYQDEEGFYCYLNGKLQKIVEWLDDGTGGKCPIFYHKGCFRMYNDKNEVIAILMSVKRGGDRNE